MDAGLDLTAEEKPKTLYAQGSREVRLPLLSLD